MTGVEDSMLWAACAQESVFYNRMQLCSNIARKTSEDSITSEEIQLINIIEGLEHYREDCGEP